MPNILRSECNHMMKFGQVIECNKKKYFSWKIIHKMWWRNKSETLFWKIKITHIFDSIALSFIQFVFIVYQFGGLPTFIETKLQTTCFYLILGFFKKIRRGFELASLPHFPYIFWRKLFLFSWPRFIVVFTSWDIGQYVFKLFANHVVTSWILKLTLSF